MSHRSIFAPWQYLLSYYVTVDSLEGHCDIEQFKLKAVDSQQKALYFLHQHHCGVKNIVNG